MFRPRALIGVQTSRIDAPDVAAVAAQLEMGVHVHAARQPRGDGQRQEAERAPEACVAVRLRGGF